MHISGLPARTVGELKNALSGTDPNTVIKWTVLDVDGDWVNVSRVVAIEVTPSSASIAIGEDE